MIGSYKRHPHLVLRFFAGPARPTGPDGAGKKSGAITLAVLAAKHRPTGINPMVAFSACVKTIFYYGSSLIARRSRLRTRDLAM